jgi:hypothetical protein
MSDQRPRSRGIHPSVLHRRPEIEATRLSRARATLLGRAAPPPPAADGDIVVRLDPRRLRTDTASLSFWPMGWLASGDPAVVWFRMPSPYHGNHGWDAELTVHGLEPGRTYVYEWTVSGRPWVSDETNPLVSVSGGGAGQVFPWPLEDTVRDAVIMGAFDAAAEAPHVLRMYPQNFRDFSFYDVVIRAV